MSGHSKWHQIRYKKAILDKKRSNLFSKLSRAILVAAKQGTNPDTNLKLKIAIERALDMNMPKENIERLLKKKEVQKQNIEEVIYEAYGPFGVALVIIAYTDNRNRTSGFIRQILSKYGGSLAESNAVLWMFDKKAEIKIKTYDIKNFEEFSLKLIDLGIDDIKQSDDNIEIICSIEKMRKVLNFIKSKGILVISSQIAFLPKNYIEIKDREKVNKLIEELLDLEDVEAIYDNLK